MLVPLLAIGDAFIPVLVFCIGLLLKKPNYLDILTILAEHGRRHE